MQLIKRNESKKLLEIPIEKIASSPFQARKDFDLYELTQLASSIRENGVLQPITVRPTDDGYELISGERRLRASKLAGLKTIPAIVSTATDRQSTIFGLLENIQRKDLNFFEEAEGIERLLCDFGLSYSEISLRLGMARSTLSNKLRLLRLNPDLRRRILSASLTEHHARAFLRLDDSMVEQALNTVIAASLTAGETDKLIESMLCPKKEEVKEKRTAVCDSRLFGNSIKRVVETFRKQGFEATTTKSEDENCLKYIITIPKK